MEKIDLPSFYKLGAQLNPITRIIPANTKWIDMFLWALAAKPALEQLFQEYPLEVCKNAGAEVLAEISFWADVANAPQPPGNAQNPLAQAEQFRVQGLVNKVYLFEAVLHAELQQLSTYQVAGKGAYSTAKLVDRAEEVFPPNIRAKLPPDAVKDVQEAGRCLAFDNPTASAFHILRAAETVIHAYYVHICHPSDPKVKLDNWGQYVIHLGKSNDAEVKRIVAIIDNLREHDRNLIMHPEIFLGADDAFELFEIAQGVMISMAGRLP